MHVLCISLHIEAINIRTRISHSSIIHKTLNTKYIYYIRLFNICKNHTRIEMFVFST